MPHSNLTPIAALGIHFRRHPRLRASSVMHILWLALLTVAFSPDAEATVCTQQAHWQVYETPCTAVSGPAPIKRVDATGYGYLYFSTSAFQAIQCGEVMGEGVESLNLYLNKFGEYSNWPCMSGNCYTPLSAIQGDERPWVAIVDPTLKHAEVMASLLVEATSPEVVPVVARIEERLDPTLVGDDCKDDLDLLAQIFDVIEAKATRAGNLVGVNLSLTRKALAGDALSTNCQQDTLSCQISRVLDYLIHPENDNEPPSTVVVAASGNTAQPGFPSQLEHVINAGGVDLTILSAANDSVRTAETPDLGSGARALMPSSGLCLQDDDGEGWVAPAGSSNSTVITLGWLVSALLHDPDSVRPMLTSPGLWHAKETCVAGLCAYRLAKTLSSGPGGPQTISLAAPSAGADELVLGALTDDLSLCGGVEKNIDLELTLEPELIDPRLSYITILDLLAILHPTPGVEICAPCSLEEDDRDPPPPLENSFAGTRTRLKATPPLKATAVAWSIDFHSTLELSDHRKHRQLYLRLGDSFYRLRHGSKDLTKKQLDDLTKGRVSKIYLSGFISNDQLVTQLSSQPSLISIMESPLDSGGFELIHHSVPLVPQ